MSWRWPGFNSTSNAKSRRDVSGKPASSPPIRPSAYYTISKAVLSVPFNVTYTPCKDARLTLQMRSTARLFAAPGFEDFARRSLDEFRRLSQSALKLEGLEGPKDILPLWRFNNADSVDACKSMSDVDIGGFSEARLSFAPAAKADPAHAHFSGFISNKVPLDDPAVERTGYAAFRTLDRPSTLFGRSLWDLEHYTYLGLRVKTDGRKYKINVQTESIEYTDIHQHRLYVRHPGEWETVLIRWADFVRTNHGIVVEPQSDMNREKIRTIGIGLTDRLEGPFEFRISDIWAANVTTSSETDTPEATLATYIPKPS